VADALAASADAEERALAARACFLGYWLGKALLAQSTLPRDAAEGAAGRMAGGGGLRGAYRRALAAFRTVGACPSHPATAGAAAAEAAQLERALGGPQRQSDQS
jgi:hypothetical protein